MYYRIEVYCDLGSCWEGIDNWLPDIEESKKLSAPHFTKKRKYKGKFWFTEKGYNLIGKAMARYLKKENVIYRVKKIKKNKLSVNFKDDFQVVGKQKY